ncbi:hypothetical protein VLK31_34800 [Variovorax sp. H27-G14]
MTNETALITGRVRPATYPDQVRLYTAPPKKFEEIAVISANAAHDFMQKQDLLDAAVLNAKKKAAQLGANGILLDEAGDFVTGSSGVFVAQPAGRRSRTMIGTGSSNVRTGKQVSGTAIYVFEE